MGSNANKTFLNVNALLWFGALWLCLDFFILGKFSYIATGDNAEITIPALMAHSSAVPSPGLWHVFSASGNDRLALGFFGITSKLVFEILPGWAATQLFSIAQALSAFLGVFYLARQLGIAKYCSLFAAYLYGWSEANGVLVESIKAYLPMAILIISSVIIDKKNTFRWIVFLLIAAWISTTSYIPVIMPAAAFIICYWFFFVERRKRLSDWSIITLFLVLLVGLRLADYFAVGIYGSLSARHADSPDYDTLSDLSSTLSTTFYGDWTAVILHFLLLYGVIRSYQKNRKVPAIAVVYFTAMISVVVLIIVKPVLVDVIPLLRTFNLVRLLLFLPLFLFICAAIGLSEIWADIEHTRFRYSRFARGACILGPIFIVLILTVEQKYRHLGDWVSQGSYVNQFESPVYQKYAALLKAEAVPYRVTSFQMYPNFPNAYGIETVSGYQALNIKRFHDYWTMITEFGSDKFPPAVPSEFFRLALIPEGHNPNWPINKMYNLRLLSAANVKYIFSRDQLTSPSLRLLEGPDEAWSNLTVWQKIKTNIADNFHGKRHLFVYENLEAMSRFYFVSKVRIFGSEEILMTALSQANMRELRETAYVESQAEDNAIGSVLSGRSGSITLLRYESDLIELKLDQSQDSFLVVTNTYSPYWVVRLDGKQGKIIPTNHSFWGVRVPAHTQQVEFLYRPPHSLVDRK